MAASVLLTIDPKTALKSTLLRFRIRRKEVSFDGRMVAPDSHLLWVDWLYDLQPRQRPPAAGARPHGALRDLRHGPSAGNHHLLFIQVRNEFALVVSHIASAVVLNLLKLVAHLAPCFCGTQKICGIPTLLYSICWVKYRKHSLIIVQYFTILRHTWK